MNRFQDIMKGAQQLLKQMPDPVYIVDPDDRIVWVNDAFREHFGDGIGNFELQKGSWTSDGKIPIRGDDGETIAFTVLLKHCAGQAAMDKAQGQLDEKYRIMAENMLDAIVLVDSDAIVRYVSPSIQSLTGFSTKEYEGMDAFDVIHPDDRDRVRGSYVEVLQSKLPVSLEYRVIHAQGHTLYAEARVKPVLDSEGHVKYVVAVVRDVTERKKAEQLLENILDNVNAAVISTDKDFTRMTYCSASIEKIFGLSKQDIVASPIRMHTHMHPEDDAALMHEVKHQLDMGISVVKTFRLLHGEETKWIKMTIHPYLDLAGEVERIDGIMMDVTEKKRSELALEESEQRYKSLFENNLDGVFSLELSGFYFVNANRSFETITGIQFDKLHDRCFMGLIMDEDHASVYGALFHVIQRQESTDIECRIVGSAHGEKIVTITFVPIFLSGELNGIHGIVKDITARKREERELIRREERYKVLQQSLNRFSNDLANVMKVSELENRLLEEVKAVLQATRVSIEEVPRGREQAIMDMSDIWVKIGEKQQPVYLRIAMDHAMLGIEEEWLETAVHYVTILYDNLHLLEDLMKRMEDMVTNKETPKWMLRLLFQLSEKERASLSSDLHDSVLQDLIIWYRKLESLRSTAAFDKEAQRELKQIEEGLLDAIHQIRITCNELRPPFLLKMGLVESLKSLFSYARMFSNYEIEFSAEKLDYPLHEEQILGVYRIVQELINNANKHSQASKVTMALTGDNGRLHFSYSDDGVGMDLSAFEGSFQHMGIAGIEKRVFSLEGEVELKSAPKQGFHVNIYIPTNTQLKGERYGNLIG
ncbi:histidine kinase [Gordoniibacillus kamchatkensis]|uniref:histidine kinase n=1 Tax=Gordoniibacillus kamchatkensis TaxID=1590651 RepID=A0ABR5ADF1_9BACL|nr:PAS domain S-box protein [Paenibacillus sp. VKM B-2647]KIL38412.1 histidine kinase [Paenibacillus sp. VKM B-2647]